MDWFCGEQVSGAPRHDRRRPETDGSGTLGDHPIEEIVLGAFQLFDLRPHTCLVTHHCIRVPLGLTVVALREGRLGHQRPQACVVGLLGQLGVLLVCDPQLGPQLAQARGDVVEATFQQRSGHAGSLGNPPAPPVDDPARREGMDWT